MENNIEVHRDIDNIDVSEGEDRRLYRAENFEDLSRPGSRASNRSRASSSNRSRSRSRSVQRGRNQNKKFFSGNEEAGVLEGIRKLLDTFANSKDYRKKAKERRERSTSVASRTSSVARKSALKRTNKKIRRKGGIDKGSSSSEYESAEDGESIYSAKPYMRNKAKSKNIEKAVKVPSNLIDSFKPGKGNDLKLVSLVQTSSFNKNKDGDVIPWLSQLIQVAKTRDNLTKNDFNCFLFSKLDNATKKLLGDVKLSSIEPQAFLDFIVLTLDTGKTNDAKKHEFYSKARPNNDHKGVLEWYQFVYKYGIQCSMPKEDIWERFIHHLPPYSKREVKMAIRKYVRQRGEYPGADGIVFLVDVLGKDEIPEINDFFLEHNRNSGFIKKASKMNFFLPIEQNTQKPNVPQNPSTLLDTTKQMMNPNFKTETKCGKCGLNNHTTDKLR